MTITKHGVMRFKQRQKIKNNHEMMHKVSCAIKRGKLLKNYSTSPKTKCYLHDDYYYIVTSRSLRLITVFRQYKPKLKSKRLLLDEIRIKEFNNERNMAFASC